MDGREEKNGGEEREESGLCGHMFCRAPFVLNGREAKKWFGVVQSADSLLVSWRERGHTMNKYIVHSHRLQDHHQLPLVSPPLATGCPTRSPPPADQSSPTLAAAGHPVAVLLYQKQQ